MSNYLSGELSWRLQVAAGPAATRDAAPCGSLGYTGMVLRAY